jgi:hypothetical protein
MKFRNHYGRLELRTFELTRGEVASIVRAHISAKGFGAPVPAGSATTINTPFYWAEEWADEHDDEDNKPFLTVRQEFVVGQQEVQEQDVR